MSSKSILFVLSITLMLALVPRGIGAEKERHNPNALTPGEAAQICQSLLGTGSGLVQLFTNQGDDAYVPVSNCGDLVSLVASFWNANNSDEIYITGIGDVILD